MDRRMDRIWLDQDLIPRLLEIFDKMIKTFLKFQKFPLILELSLSQAVQVHFGLTENKIF